MVHSLGLVVSLRDGIGNGNIMHYYEPRPEVICVLRMRRRNLRAAHANDDDFRPGKTNFRNDPSLARLLLHVYFKLCHIDVFIGEHRSSSATKNWRAISIQLRFHCIQINSACF